MKRNWNWRIWTGLGLALFATLSYIPLFLRFASTRDFPWANLVIFAAAGVFLAGGMRRAFREPVRYRGKISGSIAGALSLLLFLLFAVGLFFAARSLPPGTSALRVGQMAPDFQLSGTDGKPVTLSQLRQGNGATLLIFYRGYW
jgi:AhpC/TSA family